MKLVADAAEYSTNHRVAGLAILVFAILILFVLPVCMAIAPPPSLVAYKPALIAEAIGSAVVLFSIAFFLLSRGMLLKTPLRVYEEGLLIQPVLSATPSIVAYADISGIDFWHGMGGRKNLSGCSVLSREGKRITSVETFIDRVQGMEFVERISPAIEAAGFTVRKEGDDRSYQVAFRRDSLAKSPAWSV